MSNERAFVRSTSAHLDVPELLRQPLTELLGVSPDAATALHSLGIKTIFDLGCSRLFADARVGAFTKDELGPAAMHGLAPSDLLDDATSYDALETLGTLPLKALRLLSDTQATKLSQILHVTTLRDFAQWPPYVAARQLVNGSFGGASMDRDALQEERLRPAFGEFPTERVYYTTLAMLQMNESATDGMKVLDGGISLDPSLAKRNGFTKPAIGALLTYSQSWYVKGITFGHLLHSLALAPGEATRIAIVDWSRRTRATSTEAISETEQLDSATSHARALSEVQNAVANEMQQGGSMSTSHAESSAYSAQASVGTGLLTSLWASGDVSGTTQGSTTDTTASSSSWSLGNRSVAASMTQYINDRTEQHSTSARNRRATAVREVSQSEHEQVSTRIVANYNHMHALTIQYYEIVQVYRVVTRLHRAERCLFIPIERIDFSAGKGDQFVERFRGALARAALNVRARELLLDEASAVEVRATSARIVAPFARPDLLRAAVRLNTAAMMARPETLSSAAAAAAARAPAATAALGPTAMAVGGVRAWDRAELATASRFLARPIVRPGSDALFVPDDTELLAITFEQVTVDKLRLDRVDPQASDTDLTVHSGRVDLPAGVRVGDLDAIHASRTESSGGSGQMTLWCAHLGRRFSLPAVPIELGTAVSRVVAFRTDQADRRRELLAHLQANNAHYTQAILRSLDSATLVLLLADYTWNGRPVIDQVEPKPVTVAGNFLVLRTPVDDGEPSGVRVEGRELTWNELLVQRGFDMGDEPDARVVPIPTNGVFAEAVLGRSNSAEKLEYTRFWNWQDSPIPLAPTEIAPVATGSRATAEDLKPGQLGQPVLNIVNPTSLPDPAGLGAVLTAVSNGNMFRDMAGLAGTQALAGQTAQGTLDAATAAAQIASTNMRAQMQKAVAMGQIAADLAKTAMGMPGSGGGNQSISAEAARVAHGEQRDAVSLTPGSGAAGGASPEIGGGGGSSGGGEGGGSGVQRAVFSSSSVGSSGQAAFDRAVWGPMGKPGGELVRDVLGFANDGVGAAGGSGGVGGGTSNVSAFSTKLYPTEMVPGAAHNTRLTNALTTVRNSLGTAQEKKTLDEVAIFVAKLTPNGQMEYAGVREHEMFFSGSLLKLTLLYASFELVARVNALAAHVTAGSAADFFAKVKADFDPKIVNAVPRITPGPWRNVSYDKALSVTPTAGGNFSVAMSPLHDQDLRSIFNNQNQNEGAKGCMRRLGFSFVNGNNDAAGFFGVVTETGIWMATDYIKDDAVPAVPGNWRSFNVPVTGGGTSSAACTCISVANMLTRMHRKELIDAAASQTMRDIFRTGGSWITVPNAGGPYSFTSTGAKVGHSDSDSAGVGPVKSEAAFYERTSDNTPFVCVWQNVPDTFAFKHVLKVIDEVIKNWP